MCYCGNEPKFELCCEPYILGKKIAATAEILMRARYSAYAIKHADYIFNTYAVEQRKENPLEEIKAFAQSCQFFKLELLEFIENGESAHVTFKAHYFYGDYYCVLSEHSYFIKSQDQWFYVSGEIEQIPDIKLSRNDLCPCENKKKFKKCHGK